MGAFPFLFLEVVPINPIIPPPFEVIPRFEAWWHMLRPAWRKTRLAKGWVQHEDDSVGEPDVMDEPLGRQTNTGKRRA